MYITMTEKWKHLTFKQHNSLHQLPQKIYMFWYKLKHLGNGTDRIWSKGWHKTSLLTPISINQGAYSDVLKYSKWLVQLGFLKW